MIHKSNMSPRRTILSMRDLHRDTSVIQFYPVTMSQQQRSPRKVECSKMWLDWEIGIVAILDVRLRNGPSFFSIAEAERYNVSQYDTCFYSNGCHDLGRQDKLLQEIRSRQIVKAGLTLNPL